MALLRRGSNYLLLVGLHWEWKDGLPTSAPGQNIVGMNDRGLVSAVGDWNANRSRIDRAPKSKQ